jgi:hypothetical protein
VHLATSDQSDEDLIQIDPDNDGGMARVVVVGILRLRGTSYGGGVRPRRRPRRSHLRTLRHTHEMVIAGLVVVIVSGLLLFAADPGTFLHSRVFWIKMALVVALLANGWRVRSAGNAALASGSVDWRRLHAAAFASMVLWLVTTLAGAALPNVG